MEVDCIHISLLKLQGNGFLIRPYQVGDEVSLQASLNDPLVYERLTNIPRPYTLADAKSWISQSTTVVTTNTKRVNFAIVVDGVVVGSVAFINVDIRQGNAQISVWVARRYWGQGLAVKALELLIAFGFEKLGLYRVSAFHVSDNEKSEHMLKKLGFQLEGVHKEEWRKLVGDRYKRFDSLHYALLRHQWKRKG